MLILPTPKSDPRLRISHIHTANTYTHIHTQTNMSHTISSFAKGKKVANKIIGIQVVLAASLIEAVPDVLVVSLREPCLYCPGHGGPLLLPLASCKHQTFLLLYVKRSIQFSL